MALNRETKSTILIVEDDEGIAELEKIQLERANYAVAMATTVDEAMAQLRKQPIDLILLDYRLPGDVHGLDFFREMKAAGFDPPVIMVTGFSNESLAIQALRAGVRDLITKSTEYLDYLPEAVDRVMGQVRMERKLAESEARLTSIIDSNKDAIIISESKHRITLFNKSAESMFRCPAGQALGQPIGRFVQRHSRETPHSEEQSAAESLTHLLHEGNVGIRPDGTEFPVELSLSRVNVAGRQFHTLIVRDITRRRQSEEALRESDRFARSTLDGLSAHIAIVDETGVIVAINQSWKAFADANGPVAGNVCEGSNYLDVCDRSVGAKSEEASPVAAGIRMVLEKAIPRFTAEYPCHSPTEKRWFTVSVTPFPGDGPRRAVIAHENITARKLAENALLISEEHLRTVTDNATTAIFMEDGSARCTFMNPAAEAMTGLSFDEVKGRILHDVIHHPWPDDRPLPLADCPIHDSMSKLKRLFRHEDTSIRRAGDDRRMLDLRRFRDEFDAPIGQRLREDGSSVRVRPANKEEAPSGEREFRTAKDERVHHKTSFTRRFRCRTVLPSL
ncbi:MAG: PAS domain S-box protein [Planctomycetota bacterium]